MTDRSSKQSITPENKPKSSWREERSKALVNVAKGGGIALLGTTGSRGLTYIYSIALIWFLGAEKFGQFTLALAVVMFIGLVSSLGFPQGIIRFGAIEAATHGKSGVHQVVLAACKVVIPASLALGLGTVLGASSLSNLIFHKPELTLIMQILGASIPFVAVQSTMMAATRALKEMRWSAIVGIVQPAIALVAAIVLVLLGMGPIGAAIAYVASYICGSILSYYYYLKMIPSEDRTGEPYPISKMLKFSLPLSMTEWMHYANERTEIFFLGLLPGSTGVSLYKIAWSLAGLETMLRLSLEQILAPYSSELSHHRRLNQLGSLYKTTAKWGFTAALMIYLVYMLYSKEIMGIFDPTLASGGGVLLMLGFAQLFNEFTGACNTILIMSGRSDLTLANTIILFGSSIALDWLLIPTYGVIGAGIAGGATVILVNVLRVVEVWWTLRIHPFKLSFIKPLMAGEVTAVIFFVLHTYVFPESLVIDIITAILFFPVFLLFIYLLKLDPTDMVVVSAVRNKLLLIPRLQRVVAGMKSSKNPAD
ncbi:hypothetical protein EG834_02910 [bacterium]|nr:hypothetical protein [bacterium]